MSDFDEDDIRKLDGGLLLVFRELLRRGQAKEVGHKLGLSQSAVSHALARLRDLFRDPLFIRRPHGLEPTKRALELRPKIEALIDLAGATVSKSGGFDPKRTERCFVVAGYDAVTMPIAPALLKAFRRQAPNAVLNFVDLLHWSAVGALRRGEIDLAIGPAVKLPPGLVATKLFDDDYCIIARRGHPKIKGGRITWAGYRDIGHVFVVPPTRSGETSLDPDEVAAIYGTIPSRSENATLAYVPRFSQAMMMVATSDAIADVPRRFVQPFAARLGLQMLDMPFQWKGMQVDVVSRADRSDAGAAWLLEQVMKVAAA